MDQNAGTCGNEKKARFVDRNELAQKNTDSLQAAESEKWNRQQYTGAGGNNDRPVTGTNYFKSSLTTVVNYCSKK